MLKIVVRLKNKNYPIFIGNQLFKNFLHILSLKPTDRIYLITDDNIASKHLDAFYEILIFSRIKADYLVISHGEKSKSLSTLNLIFTKLLQGNYDRNSVLLALGGGVVGDLTGFAAATYQRGIRFIQMPTTLLAQVDASIGGKTGINHKLGKNMIGAFHQPLAVINDLSYLTTLTRRDLSSGLAEIIKYAVAFDSVFFNWLEVNLDNILNLKLNSLTYCIKRCCELKAYVVSVDEKDNNIRRFLNFGHTYGHAIESFLEYSKWSHGEAIAAGMIIAIHTAMCLGKFSKFEFERVKKLLLRAGLPVCGPKDMEPKDYLLYMKRDKKFFFKRKLLVLPICIGSVEIFCDLQDDIIERSIENSYI